MKKQLACLFCLLTVGLVGAQIPPSPYGGTPPEIRRHLIFEQPEIDGKPIKMGFRAMVQDENGFLWLAENGFFRYDGRQLKQYSLLPRTDEGSIENVGIWRICLDHKGMIWLATHGHGLQRFDPQTESLEIFELNPQDTLDNSSHVIWNVFEDSRYRLWIGTRGDGAYLISPSRDSVVNFRHDPQDPTSISANRVTGVFEDSNKNIWLGTQFKGYNLYHEETAFFTNILFETSGENLNANNTGKFSLEDPNGQLWVTTWNGLVILDPEDLSFRRYRHDPADPNSLSGNSLYAFLLDSRQNILIGTNHGLNVYDPGRGFLWFLANEYDPNSISSNYITIGAGLFEDRDGTIWISTSDGINKIDPFTNRFEYINIPDFSERRQTTSSVIRDIVEDSSGKLWLMAPNVGLYLFDPETKEAQLFSDQSNNPSRLSSNTVIGTLLDQSGILWVRTITGLEFYDPERGYFQKFCQAYPQQCSQLHRPVYMMQDASGQIWIGGNGTGLHRLDPYTRQITSYAYEPDNPEGLGIHLIGAMADDRYGNLWLIGEGGGLHWFNPATEKFIRYALLDSLPERLDPFAIYPNFGDENGFVWFQGLEGPVRLLVDNKGGILEVKTYPLPGWNNNWRRLTMDQNSQMWIEYDNWIAPFDAEKGLMQRITFPDDITSPVAHSHSGYKYFGGTAGIYRFHPDKYEKNTTPPPIVLTNLEIANMAVPIRGTSGDTLEYPSPLLKAIPYTKSIELAYWQNDLSLEFAALSYSQPEDNQYKYILENYKPDTIYTTADRAFASFTNLDPGSYTLKVWGSNNEAVWSREPATLDIRITPPWWQTWWAYTLYVLMIAGILLWYIQSLQKKVQQKQAQLEKEQAFSRKLERLNEANQRFVPQDFLNILGKESIEELKLGDQIKTKMTVLFSDIRSYTTLSETMSPEDNFKFINGYLGRVGPVIEHHGGFISQYFGDGLMALFLKDHSAAVNAALEMQKVLSQYNEERKSKGRQPIHTGMGLNTGGLMLGIIGHRNRYDSTVISDAVNTASRMEGLTKILGGSVILSEKTFSEIKEKEHYQYRFLGKVKVKGKDQALKIYDFYDGEPVKVQRLKTQSKADFEQAIHHYFNQQFGKAADLFKEVLKVNPNDLAASYYFEQAVRFITEGVEDGWDGVEEMVVK